ncbi:NAD-specific glutamate dehydrogenase [Mycena sanguinolenta]|uniref:NAD-specific glutamate dehydrogenase n=1 Tax=Mycena sanguinolenta TaxID=230812 RepID=A0A8H6YFR2_9AGAR|nr:NAD-specific glutamate dehydrogenase [Mycena sanguinolenta]
MSLGVHPCLTAVAIASLRICLGTGPPVFKGKDEQQAIVQAEVAAKGFVPAPLVAGEVAWFYTNLGIDDTYFANESPAVISDHIIALYAAKIQAYTKHDVNSLVIDLEKINEDGSGATFIHTSPPGVTSTEGPGASVETRIDDLFLDTSIPYRLETFRSQGAVSATASQQLRCYFISKCSFPPLPAEESDDIKLYSDPVFLEKASENTLKIYQDAMHAVRERRYGPVLQHFQVEGTRQHRLVIAYDSHASGTNHFFSALSNLYHFYALYSVRKYVEQFSNGITIISLYLNPLPGAEASGAPPIEHAIYQKPRFSSASPDNPFFLPKAPGSHAVQEATYAYCGWIFAQHFTNRLGPAYLSLRNVLSESDPVHAEVLNDIKRRFREETFTRESIAGVILAYPELIRLLYVNFAVTHYPAAQEDSASLMPQTLSYQRLQAAAPLSDSELADKLRRMVPNKHDLQILEAFLVFNKHILKTNFYQPTKVALSFRLAPDFLPEVEYPRTLFGMFFVIGNEFRGFHLRFRDVARGGIRIVTSRNKENYSINQRMLFDENYGLASTQSLKNKDIPEGRCEGHDFAVAGCKAEVVLLRNTSTCSIVDLLIPGQTPGIKEPLVDLYGKPELLFFGPDEGTADMMDWAALHARHRGAETWWKSFTTGKSAETLGGVPHDRYGMTSLSIRQYVLGLYKQLGVKEKDVTKVQTGGPDGDLGSNEILLSSDKTVAIIDGSGVLADPAGLDRAELIRLAKLRVPVSHFDKSKLGKTGYLVCVEEHDVKLPSGEIVLDGTDFRNAAHLRFKADLFVPCGGRPEAVNISNMAALVDSEGKPHFKWIVEGANLFITQQARMFLEKRKVILFKDSSTNKGGVTSSSLEVLAGLALSTQEYTDLMIFKDGKPSAFYQAYVRDVQEKIKENAAAEFSCMQREHTLRGRQAELEGSDLFDDKPSREGVLRRAIPKTLVDQVGLATLMERLPEPYQRALFSSWVAAHFIYKYGVNGSSVDFFHFARDLASK